jgi:hypothetical protein
MGRYRSMKVVKAPGMKIPKKTGSIRIPFSSVSEHNKSIPQDAPVWEKRVRFILTCSRG